MLTLLVQVILAAIALPVAALLVGRALRGRQALANLATSVVVLCQGASLLTGVFPGQPDLVQSVLNVPSHIGMLTLLACYPNGRFVPRWTVVPVALGVAVQIGDAATGFGWSAQPWWPFHMVALYLVLLLGGQLIRFRRRSTAQERQQTSWPVLAVIVQMVAFTVLSSIQIGITGSLDGSPVGTALAVVLNFLAPMGFAVGLLAPGLFRVDRALHTVVVVSVVALGQLVVFETAIRFTPAEGVAPGAAGWIGAIGVAVAAWPLILLGRSVADRTVFGSATDPLTALRQLGERLTTAVGAADVPGTIAETVGKALALRGVSIELRSGEQRTWGEPDESAEAFPVRYRGEELGVIRAAPRPAETALTDRDRDLVGHLARQTGPALHDTEAIAELIDARARIVLAREEERRRLRRDLHDDLAPTFAGLSLSAEAVRAFAAARDERAVPVAEALTAGLDRAARQLRDIAYDLRPPVLDDQGLVAAIRDRVEAAGSVPAVLVDAPPERIRLPAAVETSALRIVQEAVANVRRHAAATSCRVTVASNADELLVAVEDDGVGLPEPHREGIGLRSMRERVEELRGSVRVERLATGTRVSAVLPLREPAEEAP